MEVSDWLREKKVFTLSEYFIALLEYILLFKFIGEKKSEKDNQNKGKNSYKITDMSLSSSHNNKFIEIFEYRDWIIQFLKVDYGKKDDKVMLI